MVIKNKTKNTLRVQITGHLGQNRGQPYRIYRSDSFGRSLKRLPQTPELGEKAGHLWGGNLNPLSWPFGARIHNWGMVKIRLLTPFQELDILGGGGGGDAINPALSSESQSLKAGNLQLALAQRQEQPETLCGWGILKQSSNGFKESTQKQGQEPTGDLWPRRLSWMHPLRAHLKHAPSLRTLALADRLTRPGLLALDEVLHPCRKQTGDGQPGSTSESQTNTVQPEREKLTS